MTYHYATTEEEMAAAALLRNKGWTVSAPMCPECHGMGGQFGTQTYTWSPTGGPVVNGGSMDTSWRPCSRGCERPMWYFPNTASGVYP